jgi:four helix bundle protein
MHKLLIASRRKSLDKNLKDIEQALYTSAMISDIGVRDQIQRAAVSIMSNIAEGFERGTKKEFIQFLFIAKGSAGEVRSQLYIALDLGYIKQDTFDSLNSDLLSISKKLSGFIQYLQSSSLKGKNR